MTETRYWCYTKHENLRRKQSLIIEREKIITRLEVNVWNFFERNIFKYFNNECYMLLYKERDNLNRTIISKWAIVFRYTTL